MDSVMKQAPVCHLTSPTQAELDCDEPQTDYDWLIWVMILELYIYILYLLPLFFMAGYKEPGF